MIPALLLALAPAVLEAPPYTIVHPPSLAREAAQIAAATPSVVERLSRALQAPAPLPWTLYLVSLDSKDLAGEAAREMPEWAAGVALPAARTVVIRADRIGAWRQRQLLGVLAHETAHLMMHEAAGRGAALMPPWFREGVAASLARDGEWLDFLHLWVSRVPGSDRPLSLISAGFAPQASAAMTRASYAGSFSFLSFVLARRSPDLPARVLAGLRGGLDFEGAWASAAGVPLAMDEAAWSSSIRGRTRWAAILTSSASLWMAIMLMVPLAWLVKRRRALRALERWREDEPFE